MHLFKSLARYWEPAGPVSWDVSMTATPENWRVAVRKGDSLEMSTTYETKLASWYESMGIMVVYMAAGPGGKDPYRSKVDRPGAVTHGHLAENDVHGGRPAGMPDPRRLPAGLFPANPLSIDRFSYEAGDLRYSAPQNRPPVVRRGKSLTFELSAGDAGQEIWHSLTSCAPPATAAPESPTRSPTAASSSTLASSGIDTPAVGRRTWSTPKNLPAGTYTYFCRIHPIMRGAFRVKE